VGGTKNNVFTGGRAVIASETISYNLISWAPEQVYLTQTSTLVWFCDTSLHFITKVKLALCLTDQSLYHDSVWGSGCIDPYFLDLGISWRGVVSFTPQPLYLRGKSPRYSLDMRLGGPQSRSGRRRENSWPYRDSNSDPSIVQPIASRYTDYAIPAPERTTSNIESLGKTGSLCIWNEK
jgi:hypothetical protein